MDIVFVGLPKPSTIIIHSLFSLCTKYGHFSAILEGFTGTFMFVNIVISTKTRYVVSLLYISITMSLNIICQYIVRGPIVL